MGFLLRSHLLRTGGALIFRLPGLIRHAVDRLAALVLGHADALVVGGVLEPVGEAVAAKAGEVHQVDVLDVGPLAQVLDKAPEGGGLEFRPGFVVDCHGGCSAVAECCYDVGLVIESAISHRKWQSNRRRTSGCMKTPPWMPPWPLTVGLGLREIIKELI